MHREFVNYIYNQFNTNDNAKLKNTTTIIKLSPTILVCSYSCDSCDSCIDHVVSLWNGLTSLWTQIMRKLIEAERYLHPLRVDVSCGEERRHR